MAFFDKLGESISTGSQKVAQKAKELSEVSNLNSQLGRDESIVRSSIDELGRLYFEQHRDEVESAYPEIVKRIDDANADIARIKQEILKAKGLQLCPKCGNDVPVGVKFCPSCGNEMIYEEAAPVEEKKCISCGEALEDGTVFCPLCGAKQ